MMIALQGHLGLNYAVIPDVQELLHLDVGRKTGMLQKMPQRSPKTFRESICQLRWFVHWAGHMASFKTKKLKPT